MIVAFVILVPIALAFFALWMAGLEAVALRRSSDEETASTSAEKSQ